MAVLAHHRAWWTLAAIGDFKPAGFNFRDERGGAPRTRSGGASRPGYEEPGGVRGRASRCDGLHEVGLFLGLVRTQRCHCAK
jgi:hypothetical protein